MKQIFDLIRKYYKGLIKVLILLASILIIVYLFPREAKFKYEFYKGKPWMHEDLIAEYNFPIYKAEAELSRERDSILKEYKPYFRYDTIVFSDQLKKFNTAFDRVWTDYLKYNYRIDQPSSIRGRMQERLMILKEDYLIFSSDLLNFVYTKGIVEVNNVLEQVDNPNLSIVVVKGNVANDYSFSEVFTQKKAYEYIILQVENYRRENKKENRQAVDFYKNLNLNDFIQPNLFYDIEKSDKVKEMLINEISLSAGMVQEGERIISRGEVVTPEKYRVLESLKREYEIRSGSSGNRMMILIGQIILITTILIMLFLFLYHFRKEIYLNNLHTFFILLLLISFILIMRLVIMTGVISFYLIPLVILPIIIRTFFDSRLALFIYMILLMLAGFLAPNSFEFIFLNFSAGIVAIFSMTDVYHRGTLFLTSVLVTITYSVLYFGFGILQEGDLHNISWMNFAWFAGNGVLVLLSYPLIFILEKTFGFLSEATLIEIADSNQPLLRELAEKAPGTFQHSLQVANLSEEACRVIGGNPILIRTAALYHDIGKMDDPIYFIENQTGDFNPHDNLNFERSAKIIISHVTRGVEIANKNKLPHQLVDFILTHHGTTKVQYFYRSFIKSYPEELVDDSKFSYPGPKPFTKEMAILMMADSVEAASRSLKTVDHDSISSLVEQIIDSQFEEGQFNDSPITLVEINRIKEIFKKRLSNIYHVRIEYPDKE